MGASIRGTAGVGRAGNGGLREDLAAPSTVWGGSRDKRRGILRHELQGEDKEQYRLGMRRKFLPVSAARRWHRLWNPPRLELFKATLDNTLSNPL